jgi:hypothetical protein
MRLATRFTLLLATLAPVVLGQARVVLVDIDGVNREAFERVYLTGKLPSFSRILGEVHDGKGFSTAVWFEKATSVFPSVTMPGQASIFTGALPARHGIPGNQWFDRNTGRVINYLSTTGLPCVWGFLPFGVGDCSGGLAHHHLQMPTLYEAATAAGKTSIVVFNEFWKGATHVIVPSIAEAGLMIQGGTLNCARFDVLMMNHTIEALRQYGLPDILTVYFDGADNIGHLNGTAGQATYFELGIDPLMGRLLDTLARMDPEWRDHTQFIITSDHGRTDAPAAAADKAIGDEMRQALHGAGFTAEQYRIVDNGGVVHLYLRSRAAGARWTDPPRTEDIAAAARPLARNTALAAVVEYLVLRNHGPGAGYMAYDATHPVPEETAALLRGMDTARTGDLLLVLKSGHYFGNTQPGGAQHGSIYPPDLAVPIVVALGGVNPGRSPLPISTADIARIVATYLGFPMGER